MRRYKDHDHGAQHTPHVIDRFRVDQDPKGVIASLQPNGATFTANMRSSRISALTNC
jgi:hypothetical protein